MIPNSRIAIVTECYLPARNGVTTSVVEISKQLTRAGHDVLIIAPATPPDHTSPTIEPWGARVAYVPSVLIRGRAQFQLGVATTTQMSRLLRSFQPSLIHLAAPLVLGAAGIQASRQLRVPTVAIFQTDVARFAGAHSGQWAGTPVNAWLRRLHNKSDVTLAPSTATANELRLNGVRRVKLWGRGVDSVLFSPTKRDAALRAQLAPNGETIVGYVGRLSAEKRVDLLKSVSAMPNVKVVIVGAGPEREKLDVGKAAFLGAMHGEQLARVYASLDIFVHTGPSETFCQTLQEAMASGIPVIAPAAGGPIDLVSPDRGILFHPNSATDLRDAVSHLIGDPSFRQSAGVAGLEFARTRTWPVVTDELLGYYERVMPELSRSPQLSLRMPTPSQAGWSAA